MKKILILILAIVAAIWWFKRPAPVIQPQASPSPVDQLETISYQNKTYRFGYFLVDNLNRLKLIANSDFDSSENLIKKNQCRAAINGGFYDVNDRPLGWLVSEEQELSAPIISRLLDGFLATNGQAVIDFTQSKAPVRSAVQSGPMLVYKKEPLKLNIANDELRRRAVALIAQDGQLIFLTIVGQDSELAGPYLADLPRLAVAIGEKIAWQISEAINLDGGTASAFFTDKVYLKELNPVGSIFCYN